MVETNFESLGNINQVSYKKKRELHVYVNKEMKKRAKESEIKAFKREKHCGRGCPRLSYGAALLNFLLGRTSYYYLRFSPDFFLAPLPPDFAAFTG